MRRRSIFAVLFVICALAFAGTTASAFAAATIQTDKQDYRPGETVLITGSGWEPGELVTLEVEHADETPGGGEGHDSWTVTAVGGSFSTSWYVHPDDSLNSTFLLTAVGTSGQTASVTFTDRLGLDLDQCQNGTLANLGVPCGQSPTAWANGNINGQNSEYREADGIPYRAAITGIPDGTWTIRVQYDFTKGGIYAIDRLTRFDLTQNSNPCLDTPAGVACTVGSPAFSFLMPGEVVTPGATAPALPNSGALDIAGSSSSLAAADRSMTVWVQGGTGTFVSAGQNIPSFNDGRVLQTGASTGDSAREFAFRVTLTGCPTSGSDPGCNLVLGFTGHIAAGKDWGAGLGAASIGGAPFHMRILGVDQANGTSGGNQDRSVQLDAILDQGTIVIIKDAQPNDGQDFSFSGTLGSFSLDDDSDITLSNTRTFSNVDAGAYTVTEDAPPSPWSLTGLNCQVNPSGSFSTNVPTRTVSINLEGGQTVTCTFVNAITVDPCESADCDDGNVCTDDSCSSSSGQAVCSNINNTASCDDGLFCNGTDVCSSGECTHGGDPCAEGLECDPTSSSCVECLDSGDCDAGEVCDPTTKTCGECFTDANCTGDEVCDPDTNTCVECLANGDCPTGEICDTATNSCGECFTDANCTGDEVCDPDTNTCVECLANDDCPTGEICDTATNSCGECFTDANCTGDEVCNPTTNTCVECLANGDCPTGEICDTATNSCGECFTDANCTGDEVCDLSDNTCVPCLEDADCKDPAAPACNTDTNTCTECTAGNDTVCDATGEVCDATVGQCVECLTTADCEGNEVCDVTEQECVPCLADADCKDPAAPACNTDTNTCTECTAGNDTVCEAAGEVCDATVGQCVECLTTADCEGNEVCDVTEQECVPCLADADCKDPAAPACNTDTNTCTECTAGNDTVCDAAGEVCDATVGQCVECLTTADCEGNEVCDVTEQECVPCLTDSDCKDPAAPACNTETNTCTECTAGNDTVCDATDEVCDATAGECVECLTTADCEGNEVCDVTENECVPCLTDSDCKDPAAPACNTETNTCTECTAGNDTVCDATDEVCDATAGECVECLTTEDCDGNLVCDPESDKCVQCVDDEQCASVPGLPACDESTNTCQECVPGSTDACAADEVCNPQSNTCVDCVTDLDCETGEPVCDTSDGECVECLDDRNCAADEVCNLSNSTCVDCLDNDDCNAGFFCSAENTCVSCLTDADCEDQNECTADICNGAGECEHPPTECSAVTDSSLCRFDEYPAACGTGAREFRLVFTPDVKIWPGHKLSASNPGQTFYNLITENQSPVTVEIPYPYVTVGGMPVHVYCADDLQYNSAGCFVPPAAVASYPLQITMADWAPGGRCAALLPTFGDPSYPLNAGECTLQIPLPAGQCDGRYYVNIHLDYGLKGAAPRYDGVGMSAWGSSDAYVDAVTTPTVVAINDCTPYTFSDSGSGESDTVYSTNVFKRIAGVFSQVTNNATGSPVGGVMATLKAKANGAVVSTATGDEDGYMLLNHKHTGKAMVYTVTLNVPGVGVVSTDVTLKANGWAEASYDVATRRWFVVSSGDK
jgi:Cys-rich repeat protein